MISSIDNVLVRAAASSIASGRPSSDRQRSSTASSDALVVRLARCALARRVNNATASASASGASSNTVSPSMSSGTWLVHKIRNAGSGVEQSNRERRGRVDDVLAVVEDDHGGAALEPLEQRRLATDAQRGDQRVDHLVCRSPRFRVGPATPRPAPTPPQR